MTKEEVMALWDETISDEIKNRMLDIRPKLKSFEVHMMNEQCRKLIIDNYENCDRNELVKISLTPFDKCNFIKSSPYYTG